MFSTLDQSDLLPVNMHPGEQSSPTKEAVANCVIRTIADVLAMDPNAIPRDADLARDLSVNSLDRYELQQLIEEQFNTVVDESAWDSIKRVDDVIEVLWKSVESGTASLVPSSDLPK